jgi:hypothetical protein
MTTPNTTLSIAIKICNQGKKPVLATQEFPLPKAVKDEDLTPLANKVVRAAAAAAGVKIPKVKVDL